ncbi:MAG: helix-turn-helix transcriptional regulator [Oscillospiraceae bacterium]|nr:helix-turn-helix transcriptional regulator [Oscillospiraceae bacterium]
MDFAENLKFLRKYRNLTQEKLAGKANISVNSVINYENGRRKFPSISVIVKLADALDVPPEAFTASKLLVQDDALFIEKRETGTVLVVGTDGPPSDEALENYLNSMELTVEYAKNIIESSLACLNEAGLREAVKRVQELAEIQRYTNLRRADECRENELQTDPEHSLGSDLTEDGKLSIALAEMQGPES